MPNYLIFYFIIFLNFIIGIIFKQAENDYKKSIFQNRVHICIKDFLGGFLFFFFYYILENIFYSS